MSDKTQSKYLLSVVMPVWNEEKFLSQTLDQLYLQDFPLDKLEIIIAEGGSTDRTREIAESYKKQFAGLKVYDNTGRLPSTGRNVGVRNSTAPYILILDGHTYIPTKSFLKDIIATFETSEADCLCRPQPLTPPDINEFQRVVALCRASRLGHNPGSDIYSEKEDFTDPTSSGAMYKRDVFDKIGYFDENFDACEDVDFNHRVKMAGLRSYISPKLRVFYYPRDSIQGLWKQMNRYGLGRFRFSQKHNLSSPMQWLAGAGVFTFVALLILAIMFDPMAAVFKNVFGLYVLVILLYSLLLAFKEKELGCLLFGLLIFPTIHFGLGTGFLKGLFGKMASAAKIW